MSTLKSALVLGMSFFLVSCFNDTSHFEPDADEDFESDSVTGENCANGVDDDGDDYVDCDDQDCWSHPACNPDASTDSDDPEEDTGEPEIPPDAPIGTLYVESLPEGATLKVDSVVYGNTPITVSPLLAGYHRAELLLDGYRGWEDMVSVPEDDTLSLNIELEEIPERWKDVSGTWIRESDGSMHTISESDDIISGFPGGDIIMDWTSWTISPVDLDEHYMRYGSCGLDVVPMYCVFNECIDDFCSPEQRFFKSS